MNVKELIKESSFEIADNFQTKVKTIKEKSAIIIASKTQKTLNEIYIESLKLNITPFRYIKNLGSISNKEQKKLAESTVAVIGVGGLGGHVSHLLSRIGIGCLKIVDFDFFDESNLNRQFLSKTTTIGKQKVVVVGKEIKAIKKCRCCC